MLRTTPSEPTHKDPIITTASSTITSIHSPSSHSTLDSPINLSPSDLPSNSPNWRSGIGGGRFTVDSGGGHGGNDRHRGGPLPTAATRKASGNGSGSMTNNNPSTTPITDHHQHPPSAIAHQLRLNDLLQTYPRPQPNPSSHHPHSLHDTTTTNSITTTTTTTASTTASPTATATATATTASIHHQRTTHPPSQQSNHQLSSSLTGSILSTLSSSPQDLDLTSAIPPASPATSPAQLPIPNPNPHHPNPSTYHQHQSNPLAKLACHLSSSFGPSSLPTYVGSWNSHPDSPNFGSVPSSPVHGIENEVPVESQLLTNPSSTDHHFPRPHPTTIGPVSFGRSLSIANLSSPSNHQTRPLLTDFIHHYRHDHKSDSPQFGIPTNHLSSDLNHYLAHNHAPNSFRPVNSHRLVSDSTSSGILSTFMSNPPSTPHPSFSTHSSSIDPSTSLPAGDPDHYPPLVNQSPLSESQNNRLAHLHKAASRWQSSTHSPVENIHQPIRKLAEDAIYVSSPTPSNLTNKASIEWPSHTSTADRVCWPLREPTSALGSPPSSRLSPYTPSSPYSPWSSLTPADEGPTNGHRSTTHLRNSDHFAVQLWQLYGPGDQRTPTNDALESLIRRLAELGLDVDTLRQHLNSDDWKGGLIPKDLTEPHMSLNSTGASSSLSARDECTELLSTSSDKSGEAHLRNGSQTSRLSKIYESATGSVTKVESLKSPSSGRESSLERGRKSGPGRRAVCNLAGRWQESANLNPNSSVSEMDWSAHSRSRSRAPDGKYPDWRQQASRSRSRVQEFRSDLLSVGSLPEGLCDSSILNGPLRYRPSAPNTGSPQPDPLGLFPGAGEFRCNTGPSNDVMTSNETYQHGLIQQLIGSYQAQQSEENGLQSLSEKVPEYSNLWPSGASHLSGGLLQSLSTIPLKEFEFGSRHLPIKPSQHSLLGSIPGLTQDFANLANAHAEYGYIPRLVRKTSFDEILAQRNQKRATDPEEKLPSRPENHSSSTADSMIRPNTATDVREGQYRLSLNTSGLERDQTEQSQISAPAESRDHQDFFELLNSTVCQYDADGVDLKPESYLQPSRIHQSSDSSDDLCSENLLQPFFEAGSSIVDRITPYDILSQLNQLDNSSAQHAANSQWLQDSVAPTAVQPAHKKTEGTSSARSPSDSSTSSEVSHESSLAIRVETLNGQRHSIKNEARDGHSTLSFSGGRSSHLSSIGEARKRTKQLPYSSGECGNSTNSTSSSSNGGQSGNSTQCLNCQTTETPLWRRDSEGRPLCNACGLFVNLHGTPRPAALSTGVIKRRNRAKNKEKISKGTKGNHLDRTRTLQALPRNPNLVISDQIDQDQSNYDMIGTV